MIDQSLSLLLVGFGGGAAIGGFVGFAIALWSVNKALKKREQWR